MQNFMYLRSPLHRDPMISLIHTAFQVERFRDVGIYPTADRDWPCRVIDIAIAHWKD